MKEFITKRVIISILIGVMIMGFVMGITYVVGSSKNDITNFEVHFNPDNGLTIKIDKEKEAPNK